MATIDSSLVRNELRAIRDTSNVLKKQLKDMFKQLQKDPSEFSAMEVVPKDLIRDDLTFRKVYLEHQSHTFRVVFVHWTFPDDPDRPEHVDIILAFPRKNGYKIDWDWVRDRVKK
jgi:hypothetical protein